MLSLLDQVARAQKDISPGPLWWNVLSNFPLRQQSVGTFYRRQPAPTPILEATKRESSLVRI